MSRYADGFNSSQYSFFPISLDDMSLSEIALRCGYCDYTYFSQKFKKFYGMSPREYKNKANKQ